MQPRGGAAGRGLRYAGFPVSLPRLAPALAASLIAAALAAGPAAADDGPHRRVEVGGLLGLDYFGDDIELGNSWASEQIPGTSLLAGVRGTFIALPDLAASSKLDPQLGVEAEVDLAFASTREASEGGQAGMTRLVNTFGEVFEANLGDVEDEVLPLFTGPEGRAAEMLALWKRLQPAFAAHGKRIERLTLSGRGSWRAELDKDVVVEIGRGGEAEVAERTERFLRTLGQMTARYRQPLLHADLRHADGYALRLRGVSTTAPASSAAPRTSGGRD